MLNGANNMSNIACIFVFNCNTFPGCCGFNFEHQTAQNKNKIFVSICLKKKERHLMFIVFLTLSDKTYGKTMKTAKN